MQGAGPVLKVILEFARGSEIIVGRSKGPGGNADVTSYRLCNLG